MNNLQLKLKNQLPLIALIMLIAIVSIANPSFIYPENILALMGNSTTLFIIALGATLVIYLGSIDLSCQAVTSLCTVVLAVSLSEFGIWGVIIAIAAGGFVGFISGAVHVFLKIPSFISTLAMAGIVTSLANYLSGQRSISILSEYREHSLSWMIGNIGIVPSEVIIGVVVFLCVYIFERKTIMGRYTKAIGGGELAAKAAGVRVNYYKILTFTIAGILAGIAGVLLSMRLSGGSPTAANAFLLPAIAAVVVGGTSLSGGVGGVSRTIIGSMIIVVIRTGMTFVGVGVFAQQVVFGIVLVIAVAFTTDRSRQNIVK